MQNRGWSHAEVPLLRGLHTRLVEELHWPDGENQVRESNPRARSGPLAGARGRQLQGQGPGTAHAELCGKVMGRNSRAMGRFEKGGPWPATLKEPQGGRFKQKDMGLQRMFFRRNRPCATRLPKKNLGKISLARAEEGKEIAIGKQTKVGCPPQISPKRPRGPGN